MLVEIVESIKTRYGSLVLEVLLSTKVRLGTCWRVTTKVEYSIPSYASNRSEHGYSRLTTDLEVVSENRVQLTSLSCGYRAL